MSPLPRSQMSSFPWMRFEVRKQEVRSRSQNICGSTRTGSKILVEASEVVNEEASEAVNEVVDYCETEWLVAVWLHRFRLRSLVVDSGNQAKVEVSERIFLVVAKCDSCIGSVMIVAAEETMMNDQ